MTSSKDLLEILRLLAPLPKSEKVSLFNHLRDQQDNEGTLTHPSSSPEKAAE